MGYYVSINLTSVQVPTEWVAECRRQLVDLLGSDRGFAFVTRPPEIHQLDLLAILRAWRYTARVDDQGNVEIEHFLGEKWGSDEFLYYIIAPYIREGARIAVIDENDRAWSYTFEAGVLYKEQRTIVDPHRKDEESRLWDIVNQLLNLPELRNPQTLSAETRRLIQQAEWELMGGN